MHWVTIIVALIAAAGPLIGTVITIRQQSNLINYRMDEVEKNVKSLAEKVEKLAEDLRLSATMNAGLKQLLKFMSIEGGDVSGLIERIYQEEELPVRVKSKGKRIYDGIYETVFSYIR